MDSSTKFETLLNKAKTDFILEDPKNTFLTSLFCSIPLRVNNNIPTARVSAFAMEINEQFFRSLGEKERKTLLAHEVMHMALRHVDPARVQNRDRVKWNQAGDHVINNMLRSQGFKAVDGWLCDPQYADMSTEEVYDLLPDKPQDNSLGNDIELNPSPEDQNQGQGEEQGQNQGGDDTAPNPSQEKKIKAQLDSLIMRAATQAQMNKENLAGMVPVDVLRYINELTNPTVPWEDLLLDFFLSKAKDDYSMQRPNKRYMPNFILPSLYSESLGKIVFICDASGSISEEQFKKFYSEAVHVRELMKPDEFVIASFDTKIHSVHRFKKDDPMTTPKLKGGGGTAIVPVLDFLLKEEADVAVIFTDGYYWDHRHIDDDEFKQLDDMLFWLIDDNPDYECEFGEIVHFKE